MPFPSKPPITSAFRRLPGRSLASSFFLWWNRGLTLHRLDVILRGRRTVAFRDLLAELSLAARPFEPAT